MKIFQIRENKPQQILILHVKAIKRFQKNGIIQVVKHAFVWRIIYKQSVANVSVRISRKQNIKVLVGNWLVGFIWQEMKISHAKLLIKHSGNRYKDLCFVPNLIQIIINVVTLGWKPNIHLELSKAFFQ